MCVRDEVDDAKFDTNIQVLYAYGYQAHMHRALYFIFDVPDDDGEESVELVSYIG